MKNILNKKFHFLLLVSLIIQLTLSVSTPAEFLADGIVLSPLTDDGKSRAVSWSYNSNLICIIREQTSTQRQLMIMNSDGSNEQEITPIGNPFFAEWSWEGNKLSYAFSNSDDSQSQGGIFVYDLNTQKSTAISTPCPMGDIDEDDGPFWSADDKYLAYVIRPMSTRKRQLWVADAQSGKYWRLLAERGQAQEQRWSPSVPPQLCLLTEASSGGYDAATVAPNGDNFIQLTDIGAASIDIDNPRWSPTGGWVAFNNNIDMTQSERDRGRQDCWISRPDGTEARNLTNATSPSTEKQLLIFDLIWSWDGRWILGDGLRFDNQGSAIDTIYLIDPVNGGYEPLLTTYPRKDREIDLYRSIKWSYDSTKIAIMSRRFAAKNWGPDPEFENPRTVLSIYDFNNRKLEDVLIFDEHLDRKEILGTSDRGRIEDISWSPDNRSLLLTIATIVSSDDGIVKPDVYRLNLPERLISPTASEHIGPPIGPGKLHKVRIATLTETQEQVETSQVSSDTTQTDNEDIVTVTLQPIHMTVEEAIASLPASYNQYFTSNPARNLLLFKGPPQVLADFRRDLSLIDKPAPHILVDLMAVELSDEANKKLGLDWSYAEGHFAIFQPAGRAIQRFGHVDTGEDYRVGFPSGALDTLNTVPGVGQTFYQGVGTLPREFFIRLSTLIQNGEGTILANPRTVAMSGKESLINIRKTLNYFYDEGFDVSGRPIVRKSDISADTEGRIVPTLLADGAIHLTVDVQVGNYTFTPDAGLPELTTRQSTTEVTVQEGQTLVLGGLRQQEMSSTKTKVPLLGDLPLVGGLFRHEESEIRHSVLTIFITPHIMPENGRAPEWPQLNPDDHKIVPIMEQKKPERSIKEELRKKYRE